MAPSKSKIPVNVVLNEDCLDGMKKLPDACVDLIVTDPPFNIGKQYNSPYKDNMSKDAYLKWCESWLTECIRILKPKGALYLFNYPENNAYLMPFLDKNLFFKRWMTWHYPTNTGHSKYNYTRTQHSILYYTKSKKSKECTFNADAIREPYKNPTDKRIMALIASGKTGRVPYDAFKYSFDGEDVIEMNLVKNVSKDKTEHICQLPVKLLEIFIKASSNKGEIVFDPFMGSGSTAVAAKKNGRKYMGFEISSRYHKVLNERLKKTESLISLKNFTS